MKFKPNCYHRLTIYMICISLMIFASIQLCWGLSEEEGNERTLSRRRRYLIFPEGSSLQIVYDTYHPVVDYTNLLVVGITSALAWELPSKPVYPEEELQEIYKNGSLPLLRRNDDNVEINTFKDENIAGMHPNTLSTSNGRNKFLHYLSYDNRPYEETRSRASIYFQQNKESFPSNKRTNVFSRFKTPYSNSRHHSIHPTFRKRSASENTTPTSEEIFNLKFHRTSRYKLYERLEKFIDTTGHKGRDCILKALCETGQMKQHDKPRSFLGEIITTIFSLPDLQIIHENSSDELYDEAHMEITNCTKIYPKCSQKIWKSTFH